MKDTSYGLPLEDPVPGHKTSQGPGWWEASDGLWYPPETHPDYIGLGESASAPPLPSWGPGPAPVPAPWSRLAPNTAAQGNGSRPRMLTLAVVALAVAGAIAALLVIGSRVRSSATETAERLDEETANLAADPTSEPEPQPTASPTSSPTPSPTPAPTPDSAPTMPPEAVAATPLSTAGETFPFDDSVALTWDVPGRANGSVWNVTLSPLRDLTSQVIRADRGNESPPAGIAFVGFDATLTLASAATEPLSVNQNFDWELLGASTSAVYSPRSINTPLGCGIVDDAFDHDDDVFVGGTLHGTVCIPLPIEDLVNADTKIALNFDGDRVVFANNGTATAPPAEVGISAGPTDSIERGYHASTPVTLEVFGDANGSTWNIAVTEPADMTSELFDVMFAQSPQEGAVFVGFDVDITLASADHEPLSPGFNITWEVLGGSTARAYRAGTLDRSGCGAFPGRFNDLAEVFVGGNIQGRVCIPVPKEDVAHPDTRVALNLNGRVVFSTDGPTPPSLQVQSSSLPAAVAQQLPVVEPIELTWLDAGDASNSTWSTIVGPWREIAAEDFEDVATDSEASYPDGVTVVGFDVSFTLQQAAKQPLSTNYRVRWELFGGSTLRVHDAAFGDLFGCGASEVVFDNFAEVFVGETLSGTVCLSMPVADLDHPDTRLALNIGGERILFEPFR